MLAWLIQVLIYCYSKQTNQTFVTLHALKTMSSSKVNVLSAANFVPISLHSHLA